MKQLTLNKKCTLFLLVFVINELTSQNGITNISLPVGNGDYKDQQEVHLKPPLGQLTPSGIGMGHMYIDKNIIVPNTYNSGLVTVGSVRPHDTNLPVGSIEGMASVDLGGNANYAFSLPIPPGTNGMIPSVNFNYNSSSGDGIMGMGWNLAATSVITRVNNNIFHEERTSVYDFSSLTPLPFGSFDLAISSHDNLSLDGNRMVPQGNDATPEYYYFLENENFTKIINKGTYFLVIEKNGLKKEYGNTANSSNCKLTLTQGDVAWYLNKVYDNYGNYIEYIYHKIGNEIAIKEIKYTGNSNLSLAPYNSIKFYYNTKQNSQNKFIKNNTVPNTLLLREVEVFSEGLSITKYDFTYSYNKYNYLNEVKYSAKDGSNFNSTAFVYGVNPTANKIVATEPTFNNAAIASLPKEDYISADFNNDGKTDILSLQQQSVGSIDPNTGFRLYTSMKLNINQSVGTNVNFNTTQTINFTTNNFLVPFNGFYSYLFGAGESPNAIQIGDINGDGYADFVCPKQGSNLLLGIAAYTFNPITNQLNQLIIPSFNTSQICPYNSWDFRIPGSFINNANQSTPNGLTNVTMGDFNGDGKQELFTYFRNQSTGGGSEIAMFLFDINYTSNKFLVLKSTDISPSTINVTTLLGTTLPMQRYSGFTAVDFDGDGKSELMGYRDRGNSNQALVILKVTMPLYNEPTAYCGLSFTEIAATPNGIIGNADPGDHGGLGDFNGDGNLDFMSFKLSSTKLAYGKGTDIEFPLQTISSLPGRGSLYRKLLNFDIDNDGKTDLVELFSDTAQNKININVAHGQELNNGLINIGSISNLHLPYNKDYANENCDFNYNGNPGVGGCLGAAGPDAGDSFDNQPNRIPTYNIGDYNGDGYNDILIKARNTVPGNNPDITGKYQIIFFYPDSKEKFIVKVLDGYNRYTNFNYSSLANITNFKTSGVTVSYPLMKAQPPIQVVASMVTDGISLGNSGVVPSTTFYSYNDLIIHLQGKGSMGFAKVTSVNSLTNLSTVNEFKIDNTFYYPYLFRTKTTYLPSSLLLKTVTNTLSNIVYTPHVWRKRFFSKINNSVTINHIRGITSTNSMTYDNDGNITHKQAITSSGSNNETSDMYYTNPVNAGSWINNAFLNEQVVKQYKSNAPYIRENQHTYDVAKGSLLSSLSDPSSTQKVQTDYTYDNASGVVTQVAISAPSDASAKPCTTAVFYDPYKRLPTKRTKYDMLLNYTSEATYDFQFGNVLTSKEPNGLVTNYAYDVFGRPSEITTPEGIKTNTYFNWFNAGNINGSDPKPLNPLFTLYSITTKVTGNPDVISYYDIFERNIKTETEAFNGQTISNLTQFDSKGNVILQTAPYFIPLPMGQQVLVTTNNFSPDLNELLSSTTNDGTINNVTSNTYNYNISNGEMTITTTKPDSKTLSKKMDFSDKLIQAIDNGGTLNYAYNNSFSNISSVLLGGTQIQSATFDAFARPYTVNEVNSGTKTYNYNAYGQLMSKLDANSITSTYQYDAFGRVTNSNIGPEQFTYAYNNAGIGKGQIDNVTNLTTNVIYKTNYDNLARISSQDISINAQTYSSAYEYDNLSRLTKYTYPNNFAIKYNYDSRGYATTLKNVANNQTIWQANEMDHLGNYTKYTLGNGIQSVNTYNNLGIPQSFVSGSVENMVYNVNNQNGNVNSITDNISGNIETFTYDNLDRLTASNVNSTGALLTAYDGKGNITSKWDAGNFIYDNSKINQATAVGNIPNQISHTQQDVIYNTYDQPISIEEGTEKAIITYGADGNRIKTEFLSSGVTTKKRYYFGDYEIETDPSNNVTQQINYINAPSGLLGMNVTQGSSQNLYYAYTDHLGTVTKVTNGSGAIVAQQNFDAWGRYRNPTTWNFASVPTQPNWLYRGYTGHEMLPQFDLINMNGRMYDPKLGRMLSADPVISDVSSTQAHNKYTYANNNPIKFTDPSGFTSIGQIVEDAVNTIKSGSGFGNLYKKATNFVGTQLSAIYKPISNAGNSFANAIGNKPVYSNQQLIQMQGVIDNNPHNSANPNEYLGAKGHLDASHESEETMYNDAQTLLGGQKLYFISAIDNLKKIYGWYTTSGFAARAYQGRNDFKELIKSGGAWVAGDVTDLGAQSGGGFSQAGFGVNKHLVGPGLIIAGQPFNYLKPVGALGSSPGSSIASKTLSKVIPYSSPFIKKSTTFLFGRASSTAVLGRAVGRFVPVLGWGLTTYDLWDNRERINEFIQEQRKTNETHKDDLIWHVR